MEVITEVKTDDLARKEIKEKLDNLIKKTKSLKEPLVRFKDYYTSVIKKNYYGYGSEFGAWQPLSEKYAEWKNRTADVDKRILRLYNRLIKKTFNSGVASDDKIVFEVAGLPYVRIHQVGGYAGKDRKAYIPPRPYLYSNEAKGFRQKDLFVLQKIIENYLLNDEVNK